MASIDKLQIRGIRAFSPLRDETIEFYSPLTMIVGANGCGKTTVIECLKMACTGSLPPSVAQGQSFVNDPSMTNASEVKAHIKLRFNNKSGQPTVVARLYQVIKKKTKLEFKRLDGTVRTTDAEGVKQSITQKCSDLDKHVPELLGVTAAVMENVVFCHQEESCWPLQDSSVLKKKFDDIFDSARYTKALDAIKQSKKEYKAKSGDMKVNVASLEAHRNAANALKQDLDNSEEKEEACVSQIREHQDKVSEINNSLGEYQVMISSVESMEQELKELHWRNEENDRRVREKRDNLEQEFSESSEEELQALLAGFEEGMGEKVAALEGLKGELRALHRSISDDRGSLSVISARRGEAFALKQQAGVQAMSLVALMRDICSSTSSSSLSSSASSSSSSLSSSQQLSLELDTPDFQQLEADSQQENGADAVLAESKLFLASLQRALQKRQAEADTKIASAQKAVDVAYKSHLEASRTFQKLSVELSATEEELRRIERDRARTMQDMRAASSGGRAGSISQQKAQALRELEQCKTDYNEFFQTLDKKTDKLAQDKRQGDERLRQLVGLVDKNSNLLQEMSVNRTESERLVAQENQIKADEYTCESEVRNTIAKYKTHILSSLGAGEDPVVTSHVELEQLWTSLQRHLSQTKTSVSGSREEYSRVKEDATRARAIYHQDVKRRQELERTIDKKYSTCEGDLRGCMVSLGKLMSDEEGDDVVDVDDDLRLQIDRLRVGDNCYQALSEYNRDTNNPGSGTGTGISQLTGMSSSSGGVGGKSANPEDAVLEVLRVLAQDFAETGMAFKSAKIWKEKLLKKSKKRSKGKTGGPKCPCCDRGMSDVEMAVFEQNLSDIFEKADNEALEERSKVNASSAQEVIRQFSGACQQAKGLIACRQELEAVTARVQEFQEHAEQQLSLRESQVKRALDSGEESVRVTDKCIFELGSLLNNWTNISTRFDELQTKKRRHSSMLSASGSGGGHHLSIQDLEQEQRQFSEEKEQLQKIKEKCLEEENRLSRQQHVLKDNLSRKESLMNELSQKENEIKEFDVKLAQYQEGEVRCDEQLRKKKQDKCVFERTMRVQEEQERAARLQLKTVEDRTRSDVRLIENHKSSVQQLQKSLMDIQRQSSTADLATVDAHLVTINAKIRTQEERIQTLTPTIQELTSQVTQQEHTKRIVLDNISLRAAEKERDDTLTALNKMEEVVNGRMNGKGDIRDIKRKIQRLDQEKSKIEKQAHHLEGQLSAHKDQINDIRGKLKGPLYHKIEDRFRVQNIEFETTLMAVSDLDSYHIALDNALQRFHTLRIADINKIIKDMWRLIYRGEDIDMIEIVSGAEDSAGGNKANRSYNYRVVMRKGDVPLDMRGRCSAGQRVMASIVIRLALAETLCLDCGMLCLDEPTTNLDDANKAGLAFALSRIIASRSSQQNFQLICITHDEEFVRMISEQLAAVADFRLPEYYFRISRQQQGEEEGGVLAGGGQAKYFSHIEKIPWDDMV